MSDPVVFNSVSARFELPFLFAGQAQKEFFVNEAISRIDSLLHPAIEGMADTPPGSPSEGEAWLVATSGQGAWEGKDDYLAVLTGGDWLFIAPRIGMRVFDYSNNAFLHYDAGWGAPATIAPATGGSTIDSEARTAIQQIIGGLEQAGIFSQS